MQLAYSIPPPFIFQLMASAVTVPPNPPTKHHYIPVFYLKRWAGSDGRLCQYMNPIPGKIAAVRRAPSATGFLHRVYEMRGFRPELAQQVETMFFQPVDSEANDALVLMEKYGNRAAWTEPLRSAWTRFILSLLVRLPEDVALFRQLYFDLFYKSDPTIEAEYQARRKQGEPETYLDFSAAMPLSVIEQHMFEMYFDLIDNANVGSHINKMTWRVFNFPEHCHPLLTSDRPVIRTNGLERPGTHIALPIGPRRLFVASIDPDVINELLSRKPSILAREVNKLTVESAARYVYGVDDQQLRFVSNRFGKTPVPRVMVDVIARQRAREDRSSPPHTA